ncbi:AbgT family transporter [Niveispirillum irakense]|uniref:AbgT family transporter n=1 Tax=Niveispirillum irakense TaxID=34011 RepID=UPI0003F61C39|nr:AbgT family transporter [Niveispirillum irakense]
MEAKRSGGILGVIERVGNRLPDPATLFLIAITILVVLSALLAAAGVSAVHPGTGKEIAAVSLLSAANISRLFTDMPTIFATFPPLAMVLLVMMGVGVAEKTGLIGASLGALVRAMPKNLLTFTVIFAGVQSSLATDAGYVVLIPLAGLMFHSVGRHPIAGIAAAFAGVSAGFSSNLLITGLDPLLAGITQAAARMVDPAYEVPVTANWYLMMSFVPLFSIVGTLVIDRLVEPRLLATAPMPTGHVVAIEEQTDDQRAAEKRGLKFAGITLLIAVAAMLAAVVPEGAIFRDAAGTVTPFLHALVAILFVIFLLIGIAYGIGARIVRNDKDVVRMMGQSMSDMGGYIVLAFCCAVFIALFSWSNLGVILAIEGAALLQAAGFVGLPLMLALILVSAFINILIGSASAKWAILGPVLVPMLMLVGVSPEATQAAYRVGDSFTNPITPLLPYFPLILIMCQRYVPRFGIGSLIATMLPLAVWMGIAAVGLFSGWVLLDLPLGPGSAVMMPGR